MFSNLQSTTDDQKLQKNSKNSTAKDIKSSVKSADDKINFKIEEFFVDDYQHYPPEVWQFSQRKNDYIEIVYSVCEAHKSWSEMIVEDKEVRVFVKKMGPKTPDGKDDLLTSTQPANKNPTTDKLLELEVCKSSWITHLL